MTTEPMKGYVPGGEDRTQWLFEGEDWKTHITQPVIEYLTEYIKVYREKYGFDMVNYFKFSYVDGIIPERVFYITRRSWRYHDQAHGEAALLTKVQDILQRDWSHS